MKELICGLRDFLADERTPRALKNTIFMVLIGMTAFGIVAPDTATSLRDMVLGMAF